jgi:hypothetical protein
MTEQMYGIKKHPKEDKYAYPMDTAEMQAYAKTLIDTDETLSPQDKQSLLDAVNTASELDSSWETTI